MIDEGLKILKNEGLKQFIKKGSSHLFKNYIRPILLPYYIMRLKLRQSYNIKNSILYSHNFGQGLIKPSQVKVEIYELMKILKKEKLKNIMEIGTENGGTLYLLCTIADNSANIVSIDLPGGKFGGGYPIWKKPLYKSFKSNNQTMRLIREDSHKDETKTKIKKIFKNEKLDLLFIDGDHSYEGVKEDYFSYNDLVKEGGFIVFHDIVPGPKANVGGVPDFWNQIKKKNKSYEIVYDWDQGGYGIGIIKKGGKA